MNSASPNRRLTALAAAALCLLSFPALSRAQSAPAKAIYDKASPSLVVVQFVLQDEVDREEVTALGVVVSPNTVLLPSLAVGEDVPDSHFKDFKILIPHPGEEPEELEATFLGRDQRYLLAFVKLSDPAKKLPTPLTFTDKPLAIGDPVYSVGLLPKQKGYRPVLSIGTVSVRQRGEIAMIRVTGKLAKAGGVVFNSAGDAVGYVQPFLGQYPWLGPEAPPDLTREQQHFVPASEILPALTTLPTENNWPPLPFTGIMALSGLSKDLADVYNLTDPAVEIGDVLPNSPAAAAGLEKGMIITQAEGKPLERGDEPEELGVILKRRLERSKKPGETLTLTVIPAKGQPPKTFTLKLGETPPEAHTAARFYAEDLGFTVRDAVLTDKYTRKLPQDAKGVIADFIKPDSSAQAGKLTEADFVTQLNGQPTPDVPTFKSAYESFRKSKPKEALVLQVLREGNTQIIRLEPPQ